MPNNKSNGKTAINGLAEPLPLPSFSTRGGVEGHPFDNWSAAKAEAGTQARPASRIEKEMRWN
jgi:hypothetical protein